MKESGIFIGFLLGFQLLFPFQVEGAQQRGPLIGFKRHQRKEVIALEEKKTINISPQSQIYLGEVAFKVEFSKDGKTVACATNKGEVIVYNQGEVVLKEKTSWQKLYAIEFQPRTGYLTYPENHRLLFLDLNALRISKEMRVKERQIASMAFCADGSKIAVAYLGGGMEVYDIAEGDEIFSSRDLNLYSLVFHPDGKTIFCGGVDGNIYIVDIVNKGMKSVSGHKFFIMTVDITPDGSYIASGGGDAQCFVWKLKEEELQKEFSWIHGGWVTDVQFYDNYLITACRDGKLRIFAFPKKELVYVISVSDKSLLSFDINPQGELGVSSSDGMLRFYNLNSLISQKSLP